jgi:chromosome segregation ATPase
MPEEQNRELDNMLDEMMGGNSHSPETESTETVPEAEEAPEEKETFEPFGEEEYTFTEDSAETEEESGEKKEDAPAEADSAKEKENTDFEAEKAALQKEIANYEKRLHDTQSAMHKATEERNKLQKELDALKNKGESTNDDDDDWFGNDGNEKTAELEEKITNLEEQQKQLKEEQALQEWNKEAAKIISEHDDFEELVYKKLEPLLNEESGDPAVLAAYMRWKDKTPAGAYEFAKRVFGVETPEKETKTEAVTEKDPTKGKAGLDRINSAEFAEVERKTGNMIEEVFG